MDLIGVMAIYAAVIATLALAWQIFTWRKSLDNIRVTAEIVEDTNPDGLPTSRSECVCTLVNAGGQPASLVEVWAKQTKTLDVLGAVSTRRDIGGVGLPMVIGPGQCHVWKFLFPKDQGLRCYAKDANGRIYKS